MRGDIEGWVGGGGEVRLQLLLVEALGGRMGEEEGGPSWTLGFSISASQRGAHRLMTTSASTSPSTPA